jgi:hypothetical protein
MLGFWMILLAVAVVCAVIAIVAKGWGRLNTNPDVPAEADAPVPTDVRKKR